MQMNPMNQMMQQANMMQQFNAQQQQQMNNMQQQMQGILNNPSQQQGITVIFRASGNNPGTPAVNVQCMEEDKVSSVIEKYRTKSGDNDPSKKFVFNAKSLNVTLTCAEAGISNNANIFVVATKDIKGAI